MEFLRPRLPTDEATKSIYDDTDTTDKCINNVFYLVHPARILFPGISNFNTLNICLYRFSWHVSQSGFSQKHDLSNIFFFSYIPFKLIYVS